MPNSVQRDDLSEKCWLVVDLPGTLFELDRNSNDSARWSVRWRRGDAAGTSCGNVRRTFSQTWEKTFHEGVLEHAIKELCRVYVSKSIDCEY
jgi:hypothetical protein